MESVYQDASLNEYKTLRNTSLIYELKWDPILTQYVKVTHRLDCNGLNAVAVVNTSGGASSPSLQSYGKEISEKTLEKLSPLLNKVLILDIQDNRPPNTCTNSLGNLRVTPTVIRWFPNADIHTGPPNLPCKPAVLVIMVPKMDQQLHFPSIPIGIRRAVINFSFNMNYGGPKRISVPSKELPGSLTEVVILFNQTLGPYGYGKSNGHQHCRSGGVELGSYIVGHIKNVRFILVGTETPQFGLLGVNNEEYGFSIQTQVPHNQQIMRHLFVRGWDFDFHGMGETQFRAKLKDNVRFLSHQQYRQYTQI
jgi:hypothetical protein